MCWVYLWSLYLVLAIPLGSTQQLLSNSIAACQVLAYLACKDCFAFFPPPHFPTCSKPASSSLLSLSVLLCPLSFSASTPFPDLLPMSLINLILHQTCIADSWYLVWGTEGGCLSVGPLRHCLPPIIPHPLPPHLTLWHWDTIQSEKWVSSHVKYEEESLSH